MFVDEAKRKVTVKLVPRIDLQAVAEKFVMNFTYKYVYTMQILCIIILFVCRVQELLARKTVFLRLDWSLQVNLSTTLTFL